MTIDIEKPKPFGDAKMYALLTMISGGVRASLLRLRQDPSYAKALASFYGLTAIQLLIQLVMVPFYLSTIGKVAFGALMVLLAIANMAGLGIAWVQGSLLHAIGKRFFADDPRRDASLSSAYTAVKLISAGYGIVAALVIVLISFLPKAWLFGEIPPALSEDLHVAILLLAAYYLFLNDMASEYCMLCAAKQLMEANMALAFGMIVFLILVVPSLLAGAGLSAIIGCLSVGTVASALLARWYRRRCMAGVRFNFGPEMKQVVGEILGRNILPYAVYGVAFTLLQADTIIIGLLGGAAMVAEFVLVWKIAEIMLMMIWKISEGLQPNMIEANVKEDAHSIRDFYRFARYGTCVLALFAGIFYALLGPEIVALWVGKDNAPSNIWYYVAAGGAIFWLANARVSSIFAYTLKQFKILNLILVAEVIVKLSLIAILISTFTFGAPMIVINIVHLFGAAWAYLWLGRHVTPGKENKT